MLIEQSCYHDQKEWELSLQRIQSARPRHQPILRDFAEWLRFDRHLQPATIYGSLSYARRFLEMIANEGDPKRALRLLTPDNVESFFLDLAKRSGVGAQRRFRTDVRRVLCYARHRGWTTHAVENAIPGLRRYRLADIPRGIDDLQICQLLETVPDNTPVGIRDRAILIMLSVYGARAGQLRTLRLDDVLWKKRQVRLPAHKRGKSILHTLTPQVAQAISRYLLDVRPEAPYREVFLRCRRPFTPLGASAITRVVYTRLRRAGIKTESKGAHIFRHAFATRLLRKRYPLKTIADLLGHHDFASVAIYTKVDEPALREIACPWPELL